MAGGFEVETGTYVGDGTTGRLIEYTFGPDNAASAFVWVFRDAAPASAVDQQCIKGANMDSGLHAGDALNGGDVFTNTGITAIQLDGFLIDDDDSVNLLGETYFWIAASGSDAVGITPIGHRGLVTTASINLGTIFPVFHENAEFLSMHNVDFNSKPEVIIGWKGGGDVETFDLETLLNWTGSTNTTDAYIGWDPAPANGVTIHKIKLFNNSVHIDETSNLYGGWAVRTTSGQIEVNQYVGDGSASRFISTKTGENPTAILIKNYPKEAGPGTVDGPARGPVWSFSPMPDGEAMHVNSVGVASEGGLETGLVLSRGVGGFTIGSDVRVNQSGVNYFYVSFLASTEPEPEPPFVELPGAYQSPFNLYTTPYSLTKAGVAVDERLRRTRII